MAGQQRSEQKLLTNGRAGGGGASRRGGGSGGALSAASLPSNLHTMSVRQLKAVCAAHGLVAQGGSSDEIIRQLEAHVYGGHEPMLLEDKGPRKPRGGKGKAKRKAADSDEEDAPYEEEGGDEDD